MSPNPTRPRRRHRRRLHPLAVAALVIAAVAAITFYAFNRGVPFVHHFTLNALVTNSVNVRGGDPVRIGGIDVGQVVAVAPAGSDSKIELTLQPSALPIHRNATIRIRDRLFLEGSYYLELDPGTASAPGIADGGTIPLAQTSSPVQFFQLLSTFDLPTRNSLTETVNELATGLVSQSDHPLDSGAAGLKATAAQLQPLLADTAVVTRSFRGTTPGDVGRLLSSSSRVAGTLASSSPQLADFVRSLGTTAQALTSSDGSLARSVAGLDQTLRVAPASLSAVDAALPPVATLARTLDPSLKAAPPLLDQVTTTAQQLAAALGPAQRGPLVTSLRATFQELPSVLTQLARAFPVGKEITDCLQTHLVPVLEKTVPDGKLSTGRPVWQDFDHFLGGVAGASASFDANGPYTRFLAGAGTNTLSGTFGGQQLVGTPPPGGTELQGVRPRWVGALTPSAFAPNAPCSMQKIPSLASSTGAPDLVPAGGGAP
ncbi:MAG TPA: MlaD family protein [Solirubrobacteraceae bacterium]|jgi:virulence factor Mce-like protein